MTIEQLLCNDLANIFSVAVKNFTSVTDEFETNILYYEIDAKKVHSAMKRNKKNYINYHITGTITYIDNVNGGDFLERKIIFHTRNSKGNGVNFGDSVSETASNTRMLTSVPFWYAGSIEFDTHNEPIKNVNLL